MAKESLPLDHPMAAVYRAGAGLAGAFLLIFGALGLIQRVEFFTTHGERVLGLHSNGLLSVISIVFGIILLAAAVVGGNVAANVNTAVGALFLLSGLANLCVIRTDLNVLAFRMENIIFSFVVGLIALTCGMYGRVTGGDPRHGQQVGAEDDRPLGSRTSG